MRIPQKLVSLYDRLYVGFKGYDAGKYIHEQQEIFTYYGLDYDSAKKTVADLYTENPVFDQSMSSEHQVFFAALAHSGQVKNILEVGTFNGVNAAFLAKLFPQSRITTLDLPNDDSIFAATYGRKNTATRQAFIHKRDNLLQGFSNIEFVQKNSLSLTFENHDQYDLIWVDGAHGYPVITADITNAIRLLDKDGYLLCDDIFFSLKSSDDMYCSTAGYETLSAFQHANLITTDYIFKRLQKPFCLERFCKYIAVVRHS